MKPIVFLDRDGVLNECRREPDGPPLPPRSLAELKLLPGVEAACAELRAAGYRLVVVTNQPDVARGTQAKGAVEEINRWLERTLALDEVRVCWHDDADGCNCRKPQPGMLEDAAAAAGADLARCFMVGDRWRDIEAGRRAGCRTVLIGDGHGEHSPSTPDFCFSGLFEFASALGQLAPTGAGTTLDFDDKGTNHQEERGAHSVIH